MINEGTIAAIATARGEAGIGVIRISGPESLLIAKKVSRKENLEDHKMTFSKIYSSENKLIDEVLLCYMKKPHSYTGEDVVEIQCHGSSASLSELLSLVLENGAEMAQPGEFTKRAFLNGKLDLSQAEAVIDLIKAKTKKSLRLASEQLEGSLSKSIGNIRNEIRELLIEMTVNMDYPDEDIEEITYNNMYERLSQINDKIIRLLNKSEEGKIIREGMKLAIIGKPNVGKSSLMNLFMGEERSIVTDIAGTTRDTIEETAQIRGIPVRLIDTAGIHESEDVVEKIGIEKSRKAFDEADFILLILDASRELTEEDKELLEASKESNGLVVVNKMDIAKEKFELNTNLPVLSSSFVTGEGFEDIKDEIEKFVKKGSIENQDDPMVSNIRHIDLLKRAKVEIEEALQMIEGRQAMDFLEINVHAAMDYLGEITGDTVSGEIIDEIFRRFCLGK